MISSQLRFLFLLLTLLWIAHGIEELWTEFYAIDSHVNFVFSFLQEFTPYHAAFVVLQIMFWLTLIISYLLLLGPQWQYRVMMLPGLLAMYELHHIYKAFEVSGYYPGLYSGMIFPFLGYFYWKEYLSSKA